MNQRKRRKLKYLFIFLTIGILMIIFLWWVNHYIEYRNKQYARKIEYCQQILLTEQEWIRNHQGERGEIYLNCTQESFTGDVNPYFACQAGMGLLVGEITKTNLDIVSDYLSWHTQQLLKYQAEVSNYQLRDGILVSTGEYDSIDAYLAVYLNLIAEFARCGGDLSEIVGYEEALWLSLEKLNSLTDYQLTKVSENQEIFYTMDNLEVYEACENMHEVLHDHTSEDFLLEDREKLTEEFGKAKERYYKGLQQQLWNETEGRFEVGINGKGKIITFLGWDHFYPDAVVQVYSLACVNMSFINKKEVYEKFCEYFDWENIRIGETFDWSMLAYIAVQMDDVERAETFLKNYKNKHENNREYPLHTADAAWAARTADALIKTYKCEMKKNIIHILYEKFCRM